MILFVLAFAFFMKHTPSGRKMYAIGGGEEASKIAGINVRTYKILAFMLCGALAGGRESLLRRGGFGQHWRSRIFPPVLCRCLYRLHGVQAGNPQCGGDICGAAIVNPGKRADNPADALLYAEYYYGHYYSGCCNCPEVGTR